MLVSAGLAAHAFFVPISIAGMQIALGVATVGLLLAWERPARTPLDLPLAALVLVAVLSDLFSPYGPPAWEAATLWRSALGYLVVVHGLRLCGKPERLLLFAAAGVALSAVAGLVQYRTGLDLVHALGLRATVANVPAPGVPGRWGAMGFFTSRLTFGHNQAVLVSLFLGALAGGALQGKRALAVGAASLLGLAAIAVTFDRAAYLGLCAAGLAVVLLAPSRARRVLVPALAALLLVAALQPAVRARFQSSFSGSSNADRVFLWQRAQEIIRDHPLRGIGFANYPRVCGQYYDRVDPQFFMRTWAHNLELSTLAELGPLGLLALFWLLGAAALALVRRRREPLALGAAAAAAALFAIAQAHDVVYDTKVMYSLWLALGLALNGDTTSDFRRT